MPVDEPIVATVVLLLLQLPPLVALLSVTLELVQIVVVPVITPGLGFMVTTLLAPEEHTPFVSVAVYVTLVGVVIPVG